MSNLLNVSRKQVELNLGIVIAISGVIKAAYSVEQKFTFISNMHFPKKMVKTGKPVFTVDKPVRPVCLYNHHSFRLPLMKKWQYI
ncbi:hypothetical protein ID854_11005 [Xenorhabdus sp. M]|uniref:Uncharacterized protein n=1 Tax=Xenorhabdus szentirmaii TaxID=290112 RepID=A0AAW3YXP8_9GAMM|nr:hypothetical protein [Xenorhabdus sp. M]MBD2800968.1 hypothetical protein [Xenorhabdus sp. M]